MNIIMDSVREKGSPKRERMNVVDRMCGTRSMGAESTGEWMEGADESAGFR